MPLLTELGNLFSSDNYKHVAPTELAPRELEMIYAWESGCRGYTVDRQ
jgi:hypothetical protein